MLIHEKVLKKIEKNLAKDKNSFNYTVISLNEVEKSEAKSIKNKFIFLALVLLGVVILNYFKLITINISYTTLSLIIIGVAIYIRLIVQSVYARFSNIEKYLIQKELEEVCKDKELINHYSKGE